MKKFAFLLVLMALSMFAFVFAAGAQEEQAVAVPAELPAIDEEAAADLLGSWYMESMCWEDSCMNVAALGISSILNLNADNSVVTISEDSEANTGTWFMQDGVAYMISEGEDQSTAEPFGLNEEGLLVIGSDGFTIRYTREETSKIGSGELVEDAALEEFTGEWYLNQLGLGEASIPVSFFGVEGVLTIGDETLTYTVNDDTIGENVPFVYESGMITVVFTSTDEDTGETTEEEYILQYHDDDTLFMFIKGDEEDTMIFTREPDASTLSLETIFGVGEEAQPEGEGI